MPLTPQGFERWATVTRTEVSNELSSKKSGPARLRLLKDSEKQRVFAMVCADPPEGHARWTVRLVWCVPELSDEYIAKMEDVPETYE